MEQPSWKYILSYETDWMTRDEIVESSYEAAIKLNRMRIEHGLVSERKGLKTERRMIQTRETIRELDRILAIKEKKEREAAFETLSANVSHLNENTICDKKDLEWPVRLIRMSLWWIIRNWWHIEVVHRFQEMTARFKGKPAPVSHLVEKDKDIA